MTSRRYNSADGLTLAGRMLDQRDASRHRSPRLVQVDHEGDAAYARCRDMSDIGMKLDLTSPLALHDFVTVAFSPDIMLQGVVVWIKGRECGVAFTAPVDSAALLDRTIPQAIDLPATLALLARRDHLAVPSPRTMTTRTSRSFQPGLAVTLMSGHGREERAVISWAKDHIAALSFEPANPPQA